MTEPVATSPNATAPSEPAPSLKHLYSVAEVRAAAKRVLPLPVFDFGDGGAEDEHTLRRNEQAFDDVALLPRPLNGAASRDLSVTLFGKKLSMPLGIGPTGLSGLFWPDGECEAARAAVLPACPTSPATAPSARWRTSPRRRAGPRWMQVFVYTDRGFLREMIERAAAAKYDALVLTIDNQLLGNRERDIRNGFSIPPRFGIAGTLAAATKVRWLLRMRTTLPKITFANYLKPGEKAELAPIAARMGSLLDPEHVLGRRRLDTLLLEGPMVLKGILHHGGSEGSGCARHRWHHCFEPWRATTRRRRRFVRRAARCRRCGRRANPCPG